VYTGMKKRMSLLFTEKLRVGACEKVRVTKRKEKIWENFISGAQIFAGLRNGAFKLLTGTSIVPHNCED
jgi:hypothetical protein